MLTLNGIICKLGHTWNNNKNISHLSNDKPYTWLILFFGLLWDIILPTFLHIYKHHFFKQPIFNSLQLFVIIYFIKLLS